MNAWGDVEDDKNERKMIALRSNQVQCRVSSLSSATAFMPVPGFVASGAGAAVGQTVWQLRRQLDTETAFFTHRPLATTASGSSSCHRDSREASKREQKEAILENSNRLAALFSLSPSSSPSSFSLSLFSLSPLLSS